MDARVTATVLLCLGVLRIGATPLDDYVQKFDPTYKYEILSTFRGLNYTVYNLNMTSQTWKPDLQSQPVWWHYLTVTVPDILSLNSAGFLFIDGGSNHDAPPEPTDTFVMLTTIVATTTGSVGANLKQVPNQPIVFKKDPKQQRRTEDAIIAWTWSQFVKQNGTDPDLLLRMPMTKAGVRALDTMSDLVQKNHKATVNRFLVAGASKRGWTTWTVGAVDKRVVAIAPIVMDLLNMVKNLHHYYRSLGGWTFAFDDYFNLNFTQDLDNPYIKNMAAIIDPISYNDRFINKPKLITSTGGDEFFMVDDAKYYYDDLKGPKYLRQIPNAEHSLAGHEVGLLFGIRAFYLSVMLGKPLPEMNWKLNLTSGGGKITMWSDITPSTVTCYHASTLDGKRKDFRLLRGTPGNPSKPQVHPVLWFSREVQMLATFAGVEDSVLEFTTQTLIIPDTYPFPDCHDDSCRGSLV